VSPPRIFVHIPAYRDRECQWTLRDMFERARRPDRVFAGVCWQTVPEEDADCFRVRPRAEQVRAVSFHAREARGLGWARAQAQALWQGEEYSLQLDSHMRFADDWDELLLELLAACDSPDPVLTHYPLGYTPPDTRAPFVRPHVQVIRRFLPSGLLDFSAEAVPEGVAVDRPMPTAAVAGGFIFGAARILRDVPSDPELYFNGEEPNLAVRLWTAGFDLFSPHVDVVYHYYERKDGTRQWNDAARRDPGERQARTFRRLRLLCEPAAFSPEEVAELGHYGLGSHRGLADYEAYAGVSFAARSISRQARQYPFVRPPERRAGFPLPDTLGPAPHTRLFIVGTAGLLLNEARGTIHRLNHAAALAWCELQAGTEWRRIAEANAAARGIATETALDELRELAGHWIEQDLLCDAAADTTAGPRLDPSRFSFRARDYRLLGTVIRVRFADATLEALVHPAFAHLERDPALATPAATLTCVRILTWYYVFHGDRALLVSDTPRRLVPKLKAELLGRAIARTDHILHLHGAAVMLGKRLVLLAGASGNGKSTLAGRLLAGGAAYWCDDAVLLRRDGTVPPVRAALSVKAGATAVLATCFPDLPGLPEHEREDGVAVRYLAPPAQSLAGPAAPARPVVIVFPRHQPGAAARARRLSAMDALGRLLAECLAVPGKLTGEAVETIVETVERAACWDLVTGDLEEAARFVTEAVEGATQLTDK
jgi:hypothetical protein